MWNSRKVSAKCDVLTGTMDASVFRLAENNKSKKKQKMTLLHNIITAIKMLLANLSTFVLKIIH